MTKETLTPSLHQSHKDGIATEAQCTFGNPDCPICPQVPVEKTIYQVHEEVLRDQFAEFKEHTRAAAPDHSGLAQTVELDEATVRACIAALPALTDAPPPPSGLDIVASVAWFTAAGHEGGVVKCREALEALLPKRSKAKDLEKEYFAQNPTPPGEWNWLEHIQDFARWLESEGKLA